MNNTNKAMLRKSLAEIGLTIEEAINWLQKLEDDAKEEPTPTSANQCAAAAGLRETCCGSSPCASAGVDRDAVLKDVLGYSSVLINPEANLSILVGQNTDETTVYVGNTRVTNVTNLKLSYDGELSLPVVTLEVVNPTILNK